MNVGRINDEKLGKQNEIHPISLTRLNKENNLTFVNTSVFSNDQAFGMPRSILLREHALISNESGNKAPHNMTESVGQDSHYPP